QELVPFGIDDHVTGRAGERTLAGALDVDAVLVRDLEHGEADRGLDLAARAVALDEHHLRHSPELLQRASGAASSSAWIAAPSNAASAAAAPTARAAASLAATTRNSVRP